MLESLEEDEDKLLPDVDLAIPSGGGRGFKISGGLAFSGAFPWEGVAKASARDKGSTSKAIPVLCGEELPEEVVFAIHGPW